MLVAQTFFQNSRSDIFIFIKFENRLKIFISGISFNTVDSLQIIIYINFHQNLLDIMTTFSI